MKADPAVQRRLLDLAEVDAELARVTHRRRTLPEIASWHRLDSAERQAVMVTLAERMTEAGLVPPGSRKIG